MNMQWIEWVREVTGGASNRAIAAKIGVARSNVSHWMNDGIPAHAVILIATNYGANLADGFVAAGYLKEEDLGRLSWDESVARAPTTVLLEELRRRQRLLVS